MKVTVKEEEIYYPEWNKNHKLPKNEQICIHYRYLTGPQRDEFIGLAPIEYDSKGNVMGKFRFHIDKYDIVKCSIIIIDNLITESDVIINTGEQIGTIPEFAGLYLELADFFIAVNQNIDKKK